MRLRHLCACFAILFLFNILPSKTYAQCDCAYPILFLHGWTGDATSWEPTYTDANFMSAWGGLSDTYDAVLNAYPDMSSAFGPDGVPYNIDDDVIFQFVNDPNDLAPGCLYAIDYGWFWNQDPSDPQINTSGTAGGESDSNQSSAEKQGYAVGRAIDAILAANPGKEKVILIGHSMGGFGSREYLQRYENGAPTWWVDPADPVNGHKVAKLVTVGTPHRGSNATALGLGGLFSFDEQSEAVRDLRFSYYCGLFCGRITAPYLFSGSEDPNVIQSTRDSYDVDCDGDVDTNPIIPLNQIGSPDPENGTTDNPNMALPTNLKYTYYSSYSGSLGTTNSGEGGDGVVDSRRQWLFTGGNGEPSNFFNGSSVSVPHDGVDHRLSDHIHSANSYGNDDYFHTSQTSDVDDMVRSLDEADYPFFAYKVNIGVDYSGFCSKRADIVPVDSEYTNSASNAVDGDWYKFDITTDTPGLNFTITPSVHAGRMDFYEVTPGDYSNANAPITSVVWPAGSGVQLASSNTTCLIPGTYYMRITHEGLNNFTDWHTPYKFRVDPATCPMVGGLTATVSPLDATVNWTAVPCASTYTLRYRELGTTTWTTMTTTVTSQYINGLLPGTNYEFEISSDCGGGTAYSATVFSTTSCPVTLHIPTVGTIGGVQDGVYNVDQLITSDGLVNQGPTTYRAGNCVELLPNFESTLGTMFLAEIQPCVSTLATDGEELRRTIELETESQSTIDLSKSIQETNPKFFVRKVPQPDGSVVIEVNNPTEDQVQITEITNNKKNLLVSESANKGMFRYSVDRNNLEVGDHLYNVQTSQGVRVIKITKNPPLDPRLIRD